jgi:hypothetical protein
MRVEVLRGRAGMIVAAMVLALVGTVLPVQAQQGGRGAGRGGAPPATPRSSAPFDLTGYWVAVITQDWRQRMVTPPKGDYESLPINLAAKQAGDAWDPAKDEAAGEACKAFGAGGIMQMPTRLHITWQDDNTLQVDTDFGQQTRLFHFGNWTAPRGERPTWQGASVAAWEGVGRGGPGRGSLRIVTTNLRPGYIRRNGVPYSANATVTEFWDVGKERNGSQWLQVTSTVDDSTYLRQPWVAVFQFKKEPDGSKWNPEPCTVR